MSRVLLLLLVSSVGAWAQSSSAPAATPGNSTSKSQTQSPPPSPSQTQSQSASPAAAPARQPNLAAPRSDSIDARDLSDEVGESSSKDTQIDLSPPEDDAKAHPHSAEALKDEERLAGDADVKEFHPWDPHKAAKDVEVGDYYFKRKNYRAAEDRYREALYYKDNDALATYRLAVCLEKLERPDEAREQYENYLKILPHGPQSDEASKAVTRLKSPTADAKGK